MKNKILLIESLRGLAAWYVLFGHIVLLFKPYSFYPQTEFVVKTIFGYGHQAVLMFFIVSGFSIHYSTIYKSKEKKIEKPLKDYFFKRFKRIYPIFFISIILAILCLLLIDEPVEIKKIVFSLLFLTDLGTGAISNPIPTNFPIWSLSYEVVYYILYIPLYKLIKKIGVFKAFKLSIIISILAYIVSFYYKNHITNVLEMYWLWVGGAYIAHLYISKTTIFNSYFIAIFMASLGLMLTLENIFVIRDWSWGVFFMLLLIAGLPKCITNTKVKIYRNLIIGLISLSLTFYLTYFDGILFHPSLLRLIIPIVGLLGLSLILVDVTNLILILKTKLLLFSKSGAYSYGLYIIHWPIITIVLFYTRPYLNNILFMFLIIIATIKTVYFVAKFLELSLQPLFSKFLEKVYK